MLEGLKESRFYDFTALREGDTAPRYFILVEIVCIVILVVLITLGLLDYILVPIGMGIGALVWFMYSQNTSIQKLMEERASDFQKRIEALNCKMRAENNLTMHCREGGAYFVLQAELNLPEDLLQKISEELTIDNENYGGKENVEHGRINNGEKGKR